MRLPFGKLAVSTPMEAPAGASPGPSNSTDANIHVTGLEAAEKRRLLRALWAANSDNRANNPDAMTAVADNGLDHALLDAAKALGRPDIVRMSISVADMTAAQLQAMCKTLHWKTSGQEREEELQELVSAGFHAMLNEGNQASFVPMPMSCTTTEYEIVLERLSLDALQRLCKAWQQRGRIAKAVQLDSITDKAAFIALLQDTLKAGDIVRVCNKQHAQGEFRMLRLEGCSNVDLDAMNLALGFRKQPTGNHQEKMRRVVSMIKEREMGLVPPTPTSPRKGNSIFAEDQPSSPRKIEKTRMASGIKLMPSTLRIACQNLNKASKGVLNTRTPATARAVATKFDRLAQAMYESGAEVIATQETTESALDELQARLEAMRTNNMETEYKWEKKLMGGAGLLLGFLWRESAGLHADPASDFHSLANIAALQDKVWTRSPAFARFQVGGAASLVVVNVHLVQQPMDSEQGVHCNASELRNLNDALQALNEANKGLLDDPATLVAIVGDFQRNPALRAAKWPFGPWTALLDGEPTNFAGDKEYDNIVLNAPARQLYTSHQVMKPPQGVSDKADYSDHRLLAAKLDLASLAETKVKVSFDAFVAPVYPLRA
ncbi:hypothetical protein WJX72_012271 [[Myrmecia] bisecta]|uniref:Endonuclease/exonuclease/phosphatase domain-containing protein n=1 Tax=[Myrmecia] bisecta TaxID=41462 RepID=A0AAW1R9K7_9CHLO